MMAANFSYCWKSGDIATQNINYTLWHHFDLFSEEIFQRNSRYFMIYIGKWLAVTRLAALPHRHHRTWSVASVWPSKPGLIHRHLKVAHGILQISRHLMGSPNDGWWARRTRKHAVRWATEFRLNNWLVSGLNKFRFRLNNFKKNLRTKETCQTCEVHKPWTDWFKWVRGEKCIARTATCHQAQRAKDTLNSLNLISGPNNLNPQNQGKLSWNRLLLGEKNSPFDLACIHLGYQYWTISGYSILIGPSWASCGYSNWKSYNSRFPELSP